MKIGPVDIRNHKLRQAHDARTRRGRGARLPRARVADGLHRRHSASRKSCTRRSTTSRARWRGTASWSSRCVIPSFPRARSPTTDWRRAEKEAQILIKNAEVEGEKILLRSRRRPCGFRPRSTICAASAPRTSSASRALLRSQMKILEASIVGFDPESPEAEEYREIPIARPTPAPPHFTRPARRMFPHDLDAPVLAGAAADAAHGPTGGLLPRRVRAFHAHRSRGRPRPGHVTIGRAGGSRPEDGRLLRSRGFGDADAAFVLGSGLASARRARRGRGVALRRDSRVSRGSVPGHPRRLEYGSLAGVRCLVVRGRVHYYEGVDLLAATFPVRVSACARRALDRAHERVRRVAPRIRRRRRRGDCRSLEPPGESPLAGPNDDELGTRFPDLSAAYDRELAERAEGAIRRAGWPVRRGVYAAVAGPQFETPGRAAHAANARRGSRGDVHGAGRRSSRCTRN